MLQYVTMGLPNPGGFQGAILTWNGCSTVAPSAFDSKTWTTAERLARCHPARMFVIYGSILQLDPKVFKWSVRPLSAKRADASLHLISRKPSIHDAYELQLVTTIAKLGQPAFRAWGLPASKSRALQTTKIEQGEQWPTCPKWFGAHSNHQTAEKGSL